MGKHLDILEYKGYHTKVEFDSVSKTLHGRIEGINDLVTFESDDLTLIEGEFHKAVDDYLIFCEYIGQEPDKEYKGSFNVRIAPELHKKLVQVSYYNEDTLNNSVERAIRLYIEGEELKPALTRSKTISSADIKTIPIDYNWTQMNASAT